MMWGNRQRAVILAAALILMPSLARAVPSAAQMLSSSELYQTFSNGKVITCGQIDSNWFSGTMIGPNKAYFLSRKDKLKILKKKKKAALGSSLEKVLKQIAKIKALKKAEDPVCALADPGNSPFPDPTPDPSGGGNFDALGNVTAQGKITFKIPSSLSANINTGYDVWSANCVGCHEAKLNKSYTALKSAFAGEPQMSFALNLPDEDIAQITAYLNRYRY